jgi:hypothetical protein
MRRELGETCMSSSDFRSIAFFAAIAIIFCFTGATTAAFAQAAPSVKGTRTCGQQQPLCVAGCLKDGVLPQRCHAGCSDLLRKCLIDGCWVNVALRQCGLVKQ